MKKLRQRVKHRRNAGKLIHHNLLRSVKKFAERIYERHQVISAWLTKLGVNAEIAAEDAFLPYRTCNQRREFRSTEEAHKEDN